MQDNNRYSSKATSTTAGFTLLEYIIVVSMLGILSAIAAPNWLSFVNRQRLNTAQNQVYRALQEAKSNAMRDKLSWQFSIREVPVNRKTIVQWAIHPQSTNPIAATWQSLEPQIQIYTKETTIYTDKKNGIRRVRFNYIGNTSGQLGQLTLSAKNGGKLRRCVYISTLIGTIRTGKEQPKANKDKKQCY